MNVLIVADKSDIKDYKAIIKCAPNTSVLGAVTSVNNNFITELKEKYHPHALVIDTSVSAKKTSVSEVINDMHRVYPYIKVIVLTDEEDNADYPAFAVIRGQITNVEFNSIIKQAQDDIEKADFQQLANSNGNNEHNSQTVDLSGAGKTEKLYSKSTDSKVDNLSNLKIKVPNIKPSKRKRKRSDKAPLLIAVVATAVIVVVVTILVCVKSCNTNMEVATNDEVPGSVVTTTEVPGSEPLPTEEEIIVSFTDAPTAPATDETQPITSDKPVAKPDNEKSKVETSKNNSSSKANSSSSSSKGNSSSSSNQSSSKSDVSVSYDKNKYNNSGNYNVSSIRLSYSSKTLKVNEYIYITATTYPKTKTVSWTSSNTYVATVNSSGKVTAMNVGTAVVTASVDGVRASCTVTVNPKPTTAPKPTVVPKPPVVQKPTEAPATKDPVHLSVSSQGIVVGQIITITLEESRGCSWKISNPSVVQICGGGSNKITVKGVKSGSTDITATNTKTGKSYTCKITVN